MLEMYGWGDALTPMLWRPLVETEGEEHEYKDPALPLLRDLAPLLPTVVAGRLLACLLSGIQQGFSLLVHGLDVMGQLRLTTSLNLATTFAATDGVFLITDLREVVRDTIVVAEGGPSVWPLLSVVQPTGAMLWVHAGALSCFGTLILSHDDEGLGTAFSTRLLDALAACAHYDTPVLLSACLATITAWAKAGRLIHGTLQGIAKGLFDLRDKLEDLGETTQLPGVYAHLVEGLRGAVAALWPLLNEADLPPDAMDFLKAYNSVPKLEEGMDVAMDN